MTINKHTLWFFLAAVVLLAIPTIAQISKARYTDVQQTVRSSGQLAGASGPGSVNWQQEL